MLCKKSGSFWEPYGSDQSDEENKKKKRHGKHHILASYSSFNDIFF